MREIVQRDASVEKVASTRNRPVILQDQLTLDGVIEDFVRLSDQRKDDFGL